jgi:hypothetical protein
VLSQDAPTAKGGFFDLSEVSHQESIAGAAGESEKQEKAI